MKKTTLNLCCALAAALLAQPAFAQFTISDAGSTSPSPGPNDIYAIYDNYQNNDGINYYWDSNPGQTFTTGSNHGGYTLTAGKNDFAVRKSVRNLLEIEAAHVKAELCGLAIPG